MADKNAHRINLNTFKDRRRCIIIIGLLCACILCITIVIFFAKEHLHSRSQEKCTSKVNETENTPHKERLVSNDYRCLAEVEVENVLQHTEEKCIALTSSVDRKVLKNEYYLIECEKKYTKYYIKIECICEGFNLTGYTCKSDYERLKTCNEFVGICSEHFEKIGRNCSCPRHKSYPNDTKCNNCKKGYRDCYENRTFTCELPSNEIDGMKACNSIVNNKEKCILDLHGSKLVCSQGESIGGLPSCKETRNADAPSHSRMSSETIQDIKQSCTNTPISDDKELLIKIVLVLLELVLFVLYAVYYWIFPCKDCITTKKGYNGKVVTGIAVFLLIVTAILCTLLLPRPNSKSIVIVSYLYIGLILLFIFENINSWCKEEPPAQSSSRNEETDDPEQGEHLCPDLDKSTQELQ